MNVLSMGLPFGTPGEPVAHYRSQRGHAVRTLAADGDADYRFDPNETAAEVVTRVARAWAPGLFLCWCPEGYPPPRALEDCPIKTVAVISDWTVYYPQLEANLGRYDAVVSDRPGAETLNFDGVSPRYLGPIYSHRTGVHRPLGLERDLDFVFAGNLNAAAHPERTRLLERVAALSDEYRVVITADLDDGAYTRLLNRARIVVNYGLRHEMNLRCFEALACGALVFLEADNREARDYLAPETDVVFYTEDTLVDLLRAHAAQAPERQAPDRAQKAERLAGEARLDAFLDALEALPSSGRPFAKRSPADQAFAEVFQYAASRNAGQRALARHVIDEARQRFPGDVPLRAADGVLRLEAATAAEPPRAQAERKAALSHFGSAATARPDAAVLWLNLAFAARHGNQPETEARFLSLALDAPAADFGGLLLGARRDPYYARWREALAYGTAGVTLLHAAAAARLAALRLQVNRTAEALDLSRRSVAWCPEVAEPYRVLAQCAEAEGRIDEALDALERSLPFAPFDADHRNALARLRHAAGRAGEAQECCAESARIFAARPGLENLVAHFQQLEQQYRRARSRRPPDAASP